MSTPMHMKYPRNVRVWMTGDLSCGAGRIAFHRRDYTEWPTAIHPRNGGLWSIKPDATDERVLIYGNHGQAGGPRRPRWRPPDRDGLALQFQEGGLGDPNYHIGRLDCDGTQTVLTFLDPGGNGNQQQDPCWRPDGTQITYSGESTTAGHSYELRTMNADGSGDAFFHDQTDGGGGYEFCSQPAWSPDGAYIVFTAYDFSAGRDSIWVMDAFGGGLTQIYDPGSHIINDVLTGFVDQDVNYRSKDPCWGTDSDTIYFASSSGCTDWFENFDFEIWVTDKTGAGAAAITAGGHLVASRRPNVSPDGTQIVFERQVDNDFFGFDGGDLYVMDTDGTDEVQITFLGNNGDRIISGSPDWGPWSP